MYADDEINVSTWVCESRGLSYNRCFSIIRDNVVVAEAFSVWGLLDLKTHRLLKTEESPFYAEEEPTVVLDLPRRLRPGHIEEMESVGERKIVYSDIDYNAHMNNTRYPNLFCDFTPDICRVRVSALMLSFLHESAYGNTLKIYRKKTEDGYMFRTVNEAGDACTEAFLRTENI